MRDGSYFTDTNLLLYSFDSRDDIKRSEAQRWIDHLWLTGEGRLSWQVLHEFYANAVRKSGVPASVAREAVAVFSLWQPAGVNLAVIERAWFWMDRAQLSYGDALILASAERLGCRWLLSEDFQEGRAYEGVTVVNPFKSQPASSLQ
jgi:predicted nucleic acid-binding protein